MKIFQSRSFEQKVKKISKHEKKVLDEEIRTIVSNPAIGDEKKGDLKGIFVNKFKIKTAQFLLAYRNTGEAIELIMFGAHENYYRDLKNYLKNR